MSEQVGCPHPGCPRPALAGGKRCERHGAEGQCLVRGCEARRRDHDWICDEHERQWNWAPGTTQADFERWLAGFDACPPVTPAPTPGGAPVSPQPQAPRCEGEGCSRPAAPGARYCEEFWEHVDEETRCMVRGCPVDPEQENWFCEGHREEHRDCPVLNGPAAFCAWLAEQAPTSTRPPSAPLPLPSHVTTHGAPAGSDAAALGAALVAATGVGLEAQGGEADEEEIAASTPAPYLDPSCLVWACGEQRAQGSPFCAHHHSAEGRGWRALGQAPERPAALFGLVCMVTPCTGRRLPGLPFCERHNHEGQRVLWEEMEGEAPESDSVVVPFLVELPGDEPYQWADAVGEGIEGALARLRRPSPCVNAQCPHQAPRVQGSAFCAGCRP